MKLTTLVLASLLLPALSLAAKPRAGNPLVSPDEIVAGLPQHEWSRVWWQWADSFDRSESPVADRTGRFCGAKQSGAVWFLAGTYGTARTIRTCTVPAGKYIFFPLINYVTFPTAPGSSTCDDVTNTAAVMTDDPRALVLEVNGKIFEDLSGHRQATRECFDIAERSGGGVAPAAANGYYIMLRPLPRGTHTLNFGGILPSMTQAVTYTLHVE